MPSIDIKAAVAKLVASFKKKAEGGLSYLEIAAFVKELVGELMALVAIADLPGPEKRALVLQAVSEVLDYVLAAGLAFPGLPMLVRLVLTFCGPAIKAALMALADNWLETIFAAKFAKRAA
jgi:hypothetical protein